MYELLNSKLPLICHDDNKVIILLQPVSTFKSLLCCPASQKEAKDPKYVNRYQQ